MKTTLLSGASRALARLAIAVPFLAAGAGAWAQSAGNYPERPIRMIIPGAAGGASDTIGRLMADKLTAILGRSVVAENRPGAGTVMASEALATAAPDGYTLFLSTNSHAINAAVRKSLPYDPIKDFQAVVLVCSQPNLMVVRKDLPVSNLREFVALAKKEPGKLTFGSAGSGAATHLSGELFKSVTNTDLLHVPYKGGTPALVDLLAGRVDVLFFPLVNVWQYARDGRLKALAITSDQRSKQVPEVPTNAEAGVPGVESGAWYGILAPAATPRPIVEKLNQAVNRILKDPDTQKRLEEMGSQIIGGTPESFDKYLKDDIAVYKKLVAQRPELRVD